MHLVWLCCHDLHTSVFCSKYFLGVRRVSLSVVVQKTQLGNRQLAYCCIGLSLFLGLAAIKFMACVYFGTAAALPLRP